MTDRQLLLARVTGELRFCERSWQGAEGAVIALRRELGPGASVELFADRLDVALPIGRTLVRVSVQRRGAAAAMLRKAA